MKAVSISWSPFCGMNLIVLWIVLQTATAQIVKVSFSLLFYWCFILSFWDKVITPAVTETEFGLTFFNGDYTVLHYSHHPWTGAYTSRFLDLWSPAMECYSMLWQFWGSIVSHHFYNYDNWSTYHRSALNIVFKTYIR